MNLVNQTDQILKERMPEFTNFGDEAAQLEVELVEAMIRFGGIGLAANQVGLRQRVYAAYIDGRALALFNPEIITVSVEMTKITEGCLSFPNLTLDVERPKLCDIKFQDATGKSHTITLDGYDARCAMHEIDHLNGVVFTAKVSRLHLSMRRKKAAK